MRLRATSIWPKKSTTCISIPSGAIKRIRERGRGDVEYVFQFLLVRLRDCNIDVSVNLTLTFQFLLVRLRAENRFETRTCEFEISIPSGAIKSLYTNL